MCIYEIWILLYIKNFLDSLVVFFKLDLKKITELLNYGEGWCSGGFAGFVWYASDGEEISVVVGDTACSAAGGTQWSLT